MVGSYVDVRDTAALPSARGGASRTGSFQTLTHIFETASSDTHVDHPLCAKCLDHIQQELQKRTSVAAARARAYQAALSSLQVCRFLRAAVCECMCNLLYRVLGLVLRATVCAVSAAGPAR
jgi:hypothetical protein